MTATRAPEDATEGWDRQDLILRLLHSLAFAERALRSALEPCEQPAIFGSDILPLNRRKVLGECTLLIRAATTVKHRDPRLERAVDQLVHLAAPAARDYNALIAMTAEPSRALNHAFPHLLLKAAGFPDAQTDNVLSACLTSAPGVERTATRQLEQAWLQEMFRTNAVPATHVERLLSCSAIGWPLDALQPSPQDCYAFTHAVMYASDMGMHSAALPREIESITADAETALAAALDADNFDLTAELLWTWPMLGARWSPAATFAFHVLAAVADEHGFLPGPAYHAQDDQSEEYRLRSSYHTSLVFGILCAAALRPGKAPPTRRSNSSTPAISFVTQGARWEREADPGFELDGFRLTVALRRCALTSDLAGTRTVLAAALQKGLASGPAVQQAVALLRRGAALSAARPDTFCRQNEKGSALR